MTIPRCGSLGSDEVVDVARNSWYAHASDDSGAVNAMVVWMSAVGTLCVVAKSCRPASEIVGRWSIGT